MIAVQRTNLALADEDIKMPKQDFVPLDIRELAHLVENSLAVLYHTIKRNEEDAYSIFWKMFQLTIERSNDCFD